MDVVRGAGEEFGPRAAEKVAAELPNADLDLMRLSLALTRTANRFTRRAETEVHRPAGLTWAGFRVLFTLWAYGELESHRAAQLSGMSRASVSSAVNTLERDGLVQRSPGGDRRVVMLSLTADGLATVRRSYEAQQRVVEADLYRDLDPDERRRLTELLERVLSTARLDGV